ncbi:MAG: methylenetetrahydromethanopterin dehydrogenase [Pirellulaceae bacterium]|nr:methylenetetrahydromethanopterin dehydrogenase [Pirellulaceae bacterium]
MSQKKILIQLDADSQASVFDAVVAIESEIDHLLQYRDVKAEDVRTLVHGAMFTRGPKELKNTAIFIGGTDVAIGEDLLKQVRSAFFGPIQVSVLLDANGANTTAAAAVIAASRHVDLSQANVLVLAATGPVGQRVARLLTHCGASVRIASRVLQRVEDLRASLSERDQMDNISVCQTSSKEELQAALEGVSVVIAAGAFGVELLPKELFVDADLLRVAIDLNAVPPLGIGGVDALDKAVERHGVTCYGAIGVGGTKMKIHQAAIQELFTANDLVLDAEEVFAIGQSLES